MGIPIISIVGRSNSGKTTLIERLVPELKKRGYKVGTIKHDAHGFEIDYEGKDTYRHFQAGTDTVVIASSNKMALIKRLNHSPSLDELVEKLFQDMDIVITEGFKTHDKPKIEVFRSQLHDRPLLNDQDSRIALVSDKRLELNVPQFSPDDINGLVHFVEETVLSTWHHE